VWGRVVERFLWLFLVISMLFLMWMLMLCSLVGVSLLLVLKYRLCLVLWCLVWLWGRRIMIMLRIFLMFMSIIFLRLVVFVVW